MQTKKKLLKDLHKTKLNIRRHSERQIKEYVRSLKMFGQIRPLVVTEDGEILVGNGMYEALLSMGEESADAYVVEGLTEAQKKKLMLADNKVYEMGFTDTSVLDEILQGLDGDFDVPGYSAELLDMLTKNPLEAEEEVVKYGTSQAVVSSEPNDDERVVYSETNGVKSQYAPPKKDEGGTFVNPEKAEQEQAETRQFIICPHCGGKIWL